MKVTIKQNGETPKVVYFRELASDDTLNDVVGFAMRHSGGDAFEISVENKGQDLRFSMSTALDINVLIRKTEGIVVRQKSDKATPAAKK